MDAGRVAPRTLIRRSVNTSSTGRSLASGVHLGRTMSVIPSRLDTQAQRVDHAPAHTTEHLANERTFLAWIRTSIAVIGLGFVMAKFSVWLRQFLATLAPTARIPSVGASLPAGLVLIAFGAQIGRAHV